MKVVSNLFNFIHPDKLIIDKIAITYTPPFPDQDYILKESKNVGWLDTWAAKKKGTIEGQDKYKQYLYQTRQYKTAIDLQFPDDIFDRNNILHLELQPRNPNNSFLRLEYNPSKIPFSVLEEVLGHVMPNGVESIFKEGKVTRIDIAFDIQGVKPHQVILDYIKARFRTYYIESGMPDSIYIGKDTGVNQLYMYDKLKEMKDKGHEVKPLSDYQPPANGLTRIELRHRPNPAPKFCDMSTLNNLLMPINIIVTPQKVKGDTAFNNMRDLCVLKGIRQVIKQMSTDEDKSFADRLTKYSAPGMFDIDKLWSTFPSALNNVCPFSTAH